MKKGKRRSIWYSSISVTIFSVAVVILTALIFLAALKKIRIIYESNSDAVITDCAVDTADAASKRLFGRIEELTKEGDRLSTFLSTDNEGLEEAMLYMSIDTTKVLFLDDAVYPKDYDNTGSTSFSKENFYSRNGIIEPYEKDEETVFGLYVLLTLADGKTAYLYEELPFSYVGDFHINYSYEEASSYLVNKHGEILAQSENAFKVEGEKSLYQLLKQEASDKERLSLAELVKSVSNGELRTEKYTYDGDVKIFSFVPVEGTNWYMVSIYSQNVVNEQLDTLILTTVILVSVVIIALSFLASILIHKRVFDKKIVEDRNNRERKMMVSAVSETHSIAVSLDLSAGVITPLLDDGKLGVNLSKFLYYEDMEKIILSLTKSRYTETLSEAFALSALRKTLNDENRNIYSEVEMTIKGENHWVAIDLTLVDSEEQLVLYMLRFIDNEKNEDIRKREALTSALASAEKANAAKTTFLNSMSHDIRTPMNGIIGFTEIAKNSIDNPEKITDCLNKISASSQKLIALFNDILDVTELETGNSSLENTDTNIVDLFNEMPELVNSEVAAKEHRLTLEIEDIEHKEVIADISKLKQVFRIIVGNAVKYTPNGGEITLSLKEKSAVSEDTAEYEFICTDNGIGMKQDFIKDIFEPFERSEDARVIDNQGAGLGLVIARNIVRMMAGDIKVESTYRKGSKFMVTFRLKFRNVSSQSADESLKKNENELSSFEEKDYSSKRILLTDDNELNREIALEILEMTGVTVECAEDGSEAVDKFEDSEPFYYDLLLMDINMPIMDGHEATKIIRAMDREDAKTVPIVAVSANAFMEDMASSKKAGMNDHIGKPISLPKLMKVLETYL